MSDDSRSIPNPEPEESSYARMVESLDIVPKITLWAERYERWCNAWYFESDPDGEMLRRIALDHARKAINNILDGVEPLA